MQRHGFMHQSCPFGSSGLALPFVEFGVKAFLLLAWGLGGGLFLLSLILAPGATKRARSRMKQLADHLGFRAVDGRYPSSFGGLPRLVGKRGGRSVDVHASVREVDRSTYEFRVVSAVVRNPAALVLLMDGGLMLPEIKTPPAPETVVTGDAGFDRGHRLRSNDAAFWNVALIPEARQRLVDAVRMGPRTTLRVLPGEVSYIESGSFNSDAVCARIPALVDLVCDLADIVESHPAQESGSSAFLQ